MVLVLKPRGSGNWAPLRVTIEGKHARVLSDMLARDGGLRPGQTLPLGSIVWRICEVRS